LFDRITLEDKFYGINREQGELLKRRTFKQRLREEQPSVDHDLEDHYHGTPDDLDGLTIPLAAVGANVVPSKDVADRQSMSIFARMMQRRAVIESSNADYLRASFMQVC
jgi:hypothetical protein